MSEYIGSRISLISKSDIRYVGTLVEINSENSTVALENVMSYGTEDRRSGEDSFPPSASLYDYILFRGSDVKDLRIEEPPKEASPAQPPQMPNDPAILGSARPPKATPTQQPNQPASQGPQSFPSHPPHFGQFAPPPFAGMPPQGFGRGFPGGPAFSGYPSMPFGSGGPGAPPGWYPPPGQGFPPGQFPASSPGVPPGAPAQHGKGPVQQKEQKPVEKDTDIKTPELSTNPKAVTAASAKSTANAPPPPVESKPDVAAALAPPVAAKSGGSNTPKGRVLPVIPLANQKPAAVSGGLGSQAAQTAAATSQQSTAQQAAAAVAAAMAKLPASGRAPVQQSQNNGVDNLTRKLNEMRTNDVTRQPRNPGQNIRGGFRGRGRGGHQGKVEIPATDFDFESANKKFNKEDLAKEAQATNVSSPDPSQANGSSITPDVIESSAANAHEDVEIPPPQPYDKTKSFFDNISSELKDREDKRSYGGPEFRSEERRKNIETFGQGSVDGYRGGFRGRGRGRGRGGRGGISFRGRGVFRGRGGTFGVDS